MPTVSVKLSDAVKSRIDRLVAAKGTTAHAFMVDAIESQLDDEEQHDAFIQAGVESWDETIRTGQAYDGREFVDYMRAKVRGENARRPRMKSLKSLAKNHD